MYTASDILKMLKMLDDELKSEIKDAEPKTHDSPYNMGFAVGLYSARMLIHDIFKAVNEDNKQEILLLEMLMNCGCRDENEPERKGMEHENCR